MQGDINRVLIEGMVKRVMADMASSPRRAVRNLVDWGVRCSQGDSKNHFLDMAQTMLQQENSAYYDGLEDILSHVDQNMLLTFGMNIGYNGCTKGVKKMREIEKREGYNIPWAISLHISGRRLLSQSRIYDDIVDQGETLGIYTYLIFYKDKDISHILPLFGGHPKSAFVLFLKDQQLSVDIAQRLRDCKNVMPVVHDNDMTEENCRIMRDEKLLYGIYTRYSENDSQKLLKGQWIPEILYAHPQFAFVLSDGSCSEKTKMQVYRHVVDVRKSQKYPLIIMDVLQDVLTIDSMVSAHGCAVSFDCEGTLYMNGCAHRQKTYNIFENRLEDILKSVSDC